MIHHVTHEIEPSQVEACVEFYGLLAFRAVEPPPGIAGRALWLEREPGQARAEPGGGGGERGGGGGAGGGSSAQIHLMPTSGAEPKSGHFAIVSPDYEATLDRLRKAGHEVDPRREHWGSPRCYVRDPAGNLIELMAWPPAPGGW